MSAMTADAAGAITGAEKLAKAASLTRFQDMSDEVKARVHILVLDTLAVIAGGLDHPLYARFIEATAVDAGPCSVMGRKGGVSLAAAATIHGGVTTVLQMQDGHRVARGHPASAIVPLLLAMAEAEPDRFDIEQILSALIAGYEVGVRVGVALGGLKPEVHDVGNWATIGASVSATYLLTNADPKALAEAIESAAAVALFPDSRSPVRGAGAHHLFGAVGTMTALQVARGAAIGMDGVRGSLEAFFLPRAGASPDPALLEAGIGADGRFDKFELLVGYIKRHPVCAHWSTTADALTNLIIAHDLTDAEIKHVEIATYAAAMNYNVDDPTNDLAARFSGRAVAGAMLENVVLAPDAFLPERLTSDAFRERMSRVTVRHDPELDAGYPAGRPVRVTITTTDGRLLSARADQPVGDGREGLPKDIQDAKIDLLLSRRFGAARAAAVRQAIEAWLTGAPIGTLTAEFQK